ncbi:MAG TPA: hypothetical protein PLI53_02645, partial [Geobacteraceae bacterium]|nr:hypothetical protein [Geobacteraceae bacterium]
KPTPPGPLSRATNIVTDEAYNWAEDRIKAGNTTLLRQAGEPLRAHEQRLNAEYTKWQAAPSPEPAAGKPVTLTPVSEDMMSDQSAETLKPAQQEFIRDRVKELGSMEAVRQAHATDSTLDRQARTVAKEMFSGQSEEAPAPLNEEASKALDASEHAPLTGGILPEPDFAAILGTLEGKTFSRTGKSEGGGFFTDSDFQTWLKENYPSSAGKERSEIIAALEIAAGKSNKTLTPYRKQILEDFRHDHEGNLLKSQQDIQTLDLTPGDTVVKAREKDGRIDTFTVERADGEKVVLKDGVTEEHPADFGNTIKAVEVIPAHGENAPLPETGTDESEEVPDHIERAVAEPREVPIQVSLATKIQTKETLNEKFSAGELTPDSPIRLTTVEELHDILTTGKLREGKDFEGRSGISAQMVDGKKPVVAYGPNDRISAAIIFPSEANIGRGEQPNEVKVDSRTDVSKLRFVIDGHKDVLSFDQLREAIQDKTGMEEAPLPEALDTQKDAGALFETEGMAEEAPLPEKAPELAASFDKERGRVELRFENSPNRETVKKLANMRFVPDESGKRWAAKDTPLRRQFVKRLEARSVDQKAHEAATSPSNDLQEPTPAQAEAGNYKKGHVRLHGFDISIENPKGSTRKGVDENGKDWETRLAHHYGYIKGTVGKDKDHVDVFIGPKPESTRIFVVDQVEPNSGTFDEHKVLLGFPNPLNARLGYLANYDKSGKSRIGAITETTPGELKSWFASGNQKKPFGAETATSSETLEEAPLPAALNIQAGTEAVADTKDTGEEAPIPEKFQRNASTTEDVGENLWYNRRNRTGKGIAWNDVKDLNDTLRVKEVTKSKVWPRPDYDHLITDGMHPFFARIVKMAYDGIALNPAGKTDKDLQRYIDVVNKVHEAVFQWAKDSSANKKFMDKVVASFKAHVPGQQTSLTSMMDGGMNFADSLLMRIWPEEMEKSHYARFGRSSEALKEVRIIGGNRALKALQPGNKDIKKVIDDLEKGWPAKQEAWQRQGYAVHNSETFPIQQVYRYTDEGKIWNYRGGSFYPSKEEARKSLTERGAYLLTEKSGRIIDGFATREEAENEARSRAKRSPGGGREMRGMNIAEAERTGPARRGTDENISSRRLQDAFGFRGVNFGRKGYINDAERQAYLNHAYDALQDLAEILGVPAKALSLNGELGIAFGAQGRGGRAAAHFVPGVNEINLTKTMGAGTLAHEWAHALDHYFGVQAGLAKMEHPYLSEEIDKSKAFGEGIRSEIVEAYQAVIQAMSKRPMTVAEWNLRQQGAKEKSRKNAQGWLDHARKMLESGVKTDKEARLAEFDALAERILSGDVGEGYVESGKGLVFKPTVAALRNLFKDATGRILDKETSTGIQSWAHGLGVAMESKEAVVGHLPQVNTDFRSASLAADRKKKGKPYWSTRREMFARAFELFINDRLAEQNFLNTFLTDANLRNTQPYPKNAERNSINAAFQTLVHTVRTRETSKGVELYDITSAVPLALRELRKLAASGKEALPHLVTIGKSFYTRGMKYAEFAKRMKTTLGDMWSRFKGLMLKVWNELRSKAAEDRGSFSIRPGEEQAAGFTFSVSEVEEGIQRNRKGIRGQSIVSQLTEAAKDFAHGFTRQFKTLPRDTFFAEGNKIFSDLEASKSVASRETQRKIISVMGKMNEAEADLFTKALVINDALETREIVRERGKDFRYPFGISEENIETLQAEINRAFEAAPKVKEAVERYYATTKELNERFAEASKALGVHGTENRFKRDKYFHHMVMRHAGKAKGGAKGAELKTEIFRSFFKKRYGGLGDINTNVVQATFKVWAQMEADIRRMELYRELKDRYDLMPELRKRMRVMRHNIMRGLSARVGFMDETLPDKVKRLWGIGREKVEAFKSPEFRESAIIKLDNEFREVAGEIQRTIDAYREKLLDPDFYVQEYTRFKEEWEKDEPFPEDVGDELFAINVRRLTGFQLSVLNGDVKPFIKPLLQKAARGREYRLATVRDHFYRTKTVGEDLIDELFLDLAEKTVGKEDLKEVLVKADPDAWMLPAEIVDTFDHIRNQAIAASGKGKRLIHVLGSGMKKWWLFAPHNVLRYVSNNTVGDTSFLFGVAPKAAVGPYLKESFDILWKMKDLEELDTTEQRRADIGYFFHKGGEAVGITVREIPRAQMHKALRAFQRRGLLERIADLPADYLDTVYGMNTFTETSRRLAAYLYFLDKWRAGEKAYGASRRELIDGLVRIEDKAYQVANDALVNYVQTSESGRNLGDWFLFWSFREGNFKRWYHLFRNIPVDESRAKAILKNSGMLFGRSAAKLPATAMIRGAQIVVMLGLLQAITTAYNWLFWPDEEDELSEEVRSKPHLILGRGDDGDVLYWQTYDAMTEIMSWVGMDNWVKHFKSIDDGNVKDVAWDVMMAPVNQVYDLWNPLLGKYALESMLGKTGWPKIQEPRPIRNRVEYFVNIFGLLPEYRLAT